MQVRDFQQTLVLGFLFFQLSCANIVPPSGGEKDSSPPQPGKIAPVNFSTNFNARKITISFDEYIVLKDPAVQIIISPPMAESPEFRMKGKNLIVSLKSTLDSNTTYTINFGEAIRDLNEGNILNNFQYVFSTGSYLDSLSISGSITDALENKPTENILVIIYNQLEDSIPYNQKPYYFAKSLKNGSFQISNMKAGDYRLFALKDENFNFLYDVEQEKIGYYADVVNINADTTFNLQLVLFQEDNISLKFFDYKIPQTGLIQFRFSKPVEHVEIKMLEPQENYEDVFMEYGILKDTTNFWYTFNHAETQSILFITNDSIIDTFTVENKLFTKDSLGSLARLTPAISGQPANPIFLDLHKGIILNFNRPVKSWERDSVFLFEDTTLMRVYPEMKFTSSINRSLEIKYPWKENTYYELHIIESAFFDYYGLTSDSIEAIFLTKSKTDYGQLTLSINVDSSSTNQKIVQLLDGSNNVIREEILSTSGNFKFEYGNLLPGTYSLKTIIDANKNGKWDTGNYLKKIQPEKIYLYPDKINLRANWESEIELNVK